MKKVIAVVAPSVKTFILWGRNQGMDVWSYPLDKPRAPASPLQAMAYPKVSEVTYQCVLLNSMGAHLPDFSGYHFVGCEEKNASPDFMHALQEKTHDFAEIP